MKFRKIMNKDPLFFRYDLMQTMAKQLQNVPEDIRGISRDKFLISSDDQLHDFIFSEKKIEPIILYQDKASFDKDEILVDVTGDPLRAGTIFEPSRPIMIPGLKVTISIPYSGDPTLWDMKPNTFNYCPPYGEIVSPGNDGIGYLQIINKIPNDKDPNTVKETYEGTIKNINEYLKWQKSQIEDHNLKLSNAIKDSIRKRREDLKKHEDLQGILNIPLKRKEGHPEIDPIQVKRKLVKPLPKVPLSGFKPEPGIQEDIYEHILKVIRHEGRTFEATPKTFQVHGEEALRDIIMAHLNGHYEGQATGETFRGKGKTDIRIEDDGRAAFVAECKVWSGSSQIIKAVDQLLGYLTWRDCELSVIIFNKNNAQFSELLKKVPKAFKDHPQFIKDLDCNESGEWRFRFSVKEDDGRELTIHVFLFNLYVN